MKKRGQLIYKALLVIIASSVVILAFTSAGKSYGNREPFYKLALAKDIAITIDLMYSLPGDIKYIYPNDLSKYDVELTQNTVTVYSHKSGRQDITIASYGFAGIEKDTINARIMAKKYMVLEKIYGHIRISGVDE
mgnify:FL=1